MPPRKYDLALDMTRMDRIVAYDPGDLTLSVEPGIPLHKIASSARGTPAISAARRAVHGPRDGGRHDRVRRRFPAAANLRHGARLRAGNGIRDRRRNRGEERRARGEECDGIRHAQADDRRAGHARRHHPDQFSHVSAAARRFGRAWRRFAGQMRRASFATASLDRRFVRRAWRSSRRARAAIPCLAGARRLRSRTIAGRSWSHSRATTRFSTAPSANCKRSRGATNRTLARIVYGAARGPGGQCEPLYRRLARRDPRALAGCRDFQNQRSADGPRGSLRPTFRASRCRGWR